MPRIGRFTIGVLFLAMVGVLAAAPGFAAETTKPSDWKISGQLEEACSCDAACPCWMDSKPTHMNCGGGAVVFIDKGSYGGVPLDGLAIGMLGQSPDNQSMMESMGHWNFFYIFLDEKADPAQRKALEALAGQILPPALPHDQIKTFWVPMTRTIEGQEHKIRIGNYETFSAHLVDGGLGGPTKIVDPPGADPIHREYLQGKTTSVKYDQDGRKWDWSNTNYMYGTFDVTSDDYAKFALALSQKMEMEKK